MKTGAVVTLMTALAAMPTAAQTAGAMPESYRQIQFKMLQTQRGLLLAMADSMPQDLYRDKASPAQRDFAEQIHHAAGAAALIASRFMGGPPPQLPDTATALNSARGMKEFVNACYDYARNLLQTQSAASRAEMVNLFGNEMPRWQVWDEINQHTFWTAGQIVANFRKHGMAPPAFAFF